MSQTDSYIVFCVEERDADDYERVINRLFLAYDYEYDNYVVYGKGINGHANYEPFFFRADRSFDMYQFVKFVVSKSSLCSYTLYNYNNMNVELEDSNYYFMESNMHPNYEIAAYDHVHLQKKRFRKILRIMKRVYNYY
jgi:hypothetical protein